MHDGKYDEAVRNLEAAMKLPGVAKPLADPTRAASGDAVTLSDRASIFLLLAEAHTKLMKSSDLSFSLGSVMT